MLAFDSISVYRATCRICDTATDTMIDCTKISTFSNLYPRQTPKMQLEKTSPPHNNAMCAGRCKASSENNRSQSRLVHPYITRLFVRQQSILIVWYQQRHMADFRQDCIQFYDRSRRQNYTTTANGSRNFRYCCCACIDAAAYI